MSDLIDRREAHKVIRYFSKLKKGSPITFLHDMLDRIETVDAVPIAFIRSEIKNTQGAYPYSLRILLDTWKREEE